MQFFFLKYQLCIEGICPPIAVLSEWDSRDLWLLPYKEQRSVIFSSPAPHPGMWLVCIHTSLQLLLCNSEMLCNPCFWRKAFYMTQDTLLSVHTLVSWKRKTAILPSLQKGCGAACVDVQSMLQFNRKVMGYLRFCRWITQVFNY